MCNLAIICTLHSESHQSCQYEIKLWNNTPLKTNKDFKFWQICLCHKFRIFNALLSRSLEEVSGTKPILFVTLNIFLVFLHKVVNQNSIQKIFFLLNDYNDERHIARNKSWSICKKKVKKRNKNFWFLRILYIWVFFFILPFLFLEKEGKTVLNSTLFLIFFKRTNQYHYPK